MLSRLMLIIGGLVVAALFAALIAPLFIDWTSFREEFEREASRIMGRSVVVHGSVDARLLPFPSVTLNDVRMGEAEDGQPMVEVARFSMEAELAPFLSGEALIFDMRLEEPKARVRLFADGTLDWARGRKSDIPARTVVLENITISGGEIELVDEQTGRTRRVTDLDAQVSARSLAGPWRVDGRGILDGEAGAFQLLSGQTDAEGALGLRARIVPERLSYTADLDGTVRISDFRPQYSGDFTLAEKRRPEEEPKTDAIRVAGRFELSNERLRVPEYRLEAGPRDDPYVVTGEATLDTGLAPEFLLTAEGQQIDVSRFANHGDAGKTGRNPQVSARQRLQALLGILADIPVPQVPGRASLALPALVVGDTTVRELRLDVKPDGDGWLVDRADALLPGRTTLEARGRLRLKGERGFAGDLLLASSQPSGLAAWLTGSVDAEIRQLKTAGFSARVDLTDDLQRFESLEIAIGNASLHGRLERESAAARAPMLSAELRGDTVRLESLQALAGLLAGDASLESVLDHSIALSLRAGRFEAFGETAEGVNAVLTLSDGALTIDRFDVASLAGAGVTLKGTLGGTLPEPEAALDGHIKAPSMQAFADLLARHLPAHPLLTRFVASAGYYDNFDLRLRAASKDAGDPVTVNVSGPVNEGRLDLRLSAPTVADLLGGGVFELEGSLFNPHSVVLAGQLGLDPLPFDGEPDASATLHAKKAAEGPATVSASVTAGSTTFSARGTAVLSAEGYLNGSLALAARSADIEPYLVMNGIALPQTGAGLPLDLSATVVTDTATITITDLAGTVDRNAFSGRMALDRMAALPKGEGAFRFDTIDFAYLAEAVFGPVSDAMRGGPSTAPLSQPFQEAADLSITLDADAFWPGFYGAVKDFHADLLWKGSELALTDMQGEWLGGQLSGRIKLANAEENGLFEARAGLSGVDLSKAVWTGPAGVVATGRADATLAIDASGQSVRAMMESASGSGEIVTSDLLLRGIDAGAFPALIEGAEAIERDITPEEVAGFAPAAILRGDTPVGAAHIPFAVASGRLRVQSLSADAAGARLTGDADIDLADGSMTGSLAVAFDAGEEAQEGTEPEVVLGYRGLLVAPDMEMNVQPLVNYLSLRRFENERRRVETLQANVLEKQRLRREAALYRARVQARAAQLAAERLQQAEEDRRRAAARERVERETELRRATEAAERERRAVEEAERKRRAATEDERRRLEAEAAARRAREEERRLPVPSQEGVERGSDLPPPMGGQMLDFDMLPDFN